MKVIPTSLSVMIVTSLFSTHFNSASAVDITSSSCGHQTTIAAVGAANNTDQVLASDKVLLSSYSDLQSLWQDCYELNKISADLLDEGRNAPATKKWVDYYVSTADQTVSDLKNVYSKTTFPPDIQSSLEKSWANAGTALSTLQSTMQTLKTVGASVKSPTDDKYPPAFWGPARALRNTASDLDKSLVDMLGVLDASRENKALILSETQGGNTSSSNGTTLHGRAVSGENTMKGVMRAISKVNDSCLNLSGELDRFNTSFSKSKPPAGATNDMFYGGAFTKQEILSQYKYMPTFVFTTDPNVARFGYRLPPRQNMLAHYTDELGKLLNIMDSELQTMQSEIPADKQQALAAPWDAIKNQFTDARNQYLSLYQLVQNTPDSELDKNIRQDQTRFGVPVLKIMKDMSSLRGAISDFDKLLAQSS